MKNLLKKQLTIALIFTIILSTNQDINGQSLAPSLSLMNKLENKPQESKFNFILNKITALDEVKSRINSNVEIELTLPEAPISRTVKDSLLVLHKTITALPIDNNFKDDDKSYLLESIDYLLAKDKTTFLMFGEGSLRDKIIDGDEAANIAGASIGVGFIKNKTALGLTFNLADPSDSIIADVAYFSGALISPTLQNSSFVLEVEQFLGENNHFFLSLDVLGSSSNWNLGESNFNAGVMSTSFKINWTPYYVKAEEIGSARLWFDFGFTIRSIFGDVAKSKYDDLRELHLTTSKTTFFGTEFGINLQVGKTMYYAKLPWIVSTESNSIDGLTGPRLVIGAKVTADFLKITK